MSEITHFTQIFREMHYNQDVQYLQPSSLNKGHMFDTCFFHRMKDFTNITNDFGLDSLFETAIILNTTAFLN